MSDKTSYKIKGIQYDDKFNIVGFKIDNEIEQKIINFNTAEDMINTGEISGQDIIIDSDGGKHIVNQDQSLDKMPVVYKENKHKENELIAIAVLLQNNEPYGYRFKSGDKFLNYSLAVTWELARRGCIQNMRASFDGENKQICGANGLNLWELDTIYKA